MFTTFDALARLGARTSAAATLVPTSLLTILAATVLTAATIAPSPVAAQTWPDRPIRIIIPFAPGGGADGVARLLAVQLEKDLGQAVVVESKAGGNTVIAAQTVARAAPDGYTLLMTGGSTMSLLPLTASTPLPYDPFKDFSPIGMLSKGPYLVAVSSSLGADTLADVLTLARTKPGAVAYASNGIGASAHIGMELLAQRAGVQMTHVPYKGFAPALGDVVSGRTP
ncbi:Bug family tripartite tricarboxylate transporter substrate binding protein [Pigmentiphaga litoralis]|uniref:Bug family tripartite tricarboxylate transporter substrate binding protein n=1 Tax=Pigmentiphaga litoralis TaxID=516702 RepID=UPI003B42F386